jgi:hypothetical protein
LSYFLKGYYICTGENPEETIKEPPKRYIIVEICSLVETFTSTPTFTYTREKPLLYLPHLIAT